MSPQPGSAKPPDPPAFPAPPAALPAPPLPTSAANDSGGALAPLPPPPVLPPHAHLPHPPPPHPLAYHHPLGVPPMYHDIHMHAAAAMAMPPAFHAHTHAHHHHLLQLPQVPHAHLFEQQVLGAGGGVAHARTRVEGQEGRETRARREGGGRKKARKMAGSVGSRSASRSGSASGSRESGKGESGAGADSTAANGTAARAKAGKRLDAMAANGVHDSQRLESTVAPAVKDAVAHPHVVIDAGATARGGERIPAVVAATVSGKRNFSDLTARDTNGRSTDSVGEEDTGHAADAAHPPATPKPPSKNLAYVNGVFMPADEARVSITDLGFAYGCGVVEEVLVIGGNCVRLAEHLGTVLFAANCLDLPLPISSNELRSVCMHVVGANSVGARSALYIQLSFGTYGTRSRRLPPPGEIVPSVVIHTEKLPPVPALHLQAGIALLPVSDSRYVSSAVGDVAVPYLSSSQLPVILALQKARSKNCVEALMIDHGSGDVTGTSAGNVFCVKFGAVYTPSAAGNSVMRRTIIKLCREELGIELREVVPVRAVGDRAISGDVPGAVTAQILERFATMNAQLLTASKRQESSPINGRGAPGNGSSAEILLQQSRSVDGGKSATGKWKHVPYASNGSRPNGVGSNSRDPSSL